MLKPTPIMDEGFFLFLNLTNSREGYSTNHSILENDMNDTSNSLLRLSVVTGSHKMV